MLNLIGLTNVDYRALENFAAVNHLKRFTQGIDESGLSFSPLGAWSKALGDQRLNTKMYSGVQATFITTYDDMDELLHQDWVRVIPGTDYTIFSADLKDLVAYLHTCLYAVTDWVVELYRQIEPVAHEYMKDLELSRGRLWKK